MCVKCSSLSDLHQFKILKQKLEILFIFFERNRYDCQSKTSKYTGGSSVKIERDLSVFGSNSENSGENKLYKLTSSVTRGVDRNTNMGNFISDVFTEDEITMYDS